MGKAVREDWVKRLIDDVNASTKPVVIVAHSLGVATALHALPHVEKKIAGAFLVAPPEVTNPKIRPKHLMTFGPYPREPLPFPSLVVAAATIRSEPMSMPETWPMPGDRSSWMPANPGISTPSPGMVPAGRHDGLCPVPQPASALIAQQHRGRGRGSRH